MQQKKLIEDLEYNRKYKEINGLKDMQNYSYYLANKEVTLYAVDDLITYEEKYQYIIDNVLEAFKMLMEQRGKQATNEQLEFAETTTKILLGELINNESVPVIPAPCGFGKSSITYLFTLEICKAIKLGKWQHGMIIVTDKLEQLKDLNEYIYDHLGYYNNEENIPYSYVLEGWTERSYEEGMCKNKEMKRYEMGMCQGCPFFTSCKISKQSSIQKDSPILLMTKARLETFADSVNQYTYYIDDNGEKQYRTLLINDEKPKMINTLDVSRSLVNKIDSDLSLIEIRSKEYEEKKVKLMDKWEIIRSMVLHKLETYSKYERIIVSNINNEPILLNDEEFILLWDELMGKKYSFELQHIHKVLTVGGLFCKTNLRGSFISTLGMKETIHNENFKTVIFDATALTDPEYSSGKGEAYENIVKFVDIRNTREFPNLTFNFYMKHKLNKSTFKSKNYLVKAVSNFISTLSTNGFTYVVTYKDIAPLLFNQLTFNRNVSINSHAFNNKVKIVAEEDKTFYFGNTKGSNKAEKCENMIQVGWNNLPDYTYATNYLCTGFNEEKKMDIIRTCSNIEHSESFAKYLMMEDYKFKHQHLHQFKYFCMLTDFIQEVFRTKLRDYTYDDQITIHCFSIDPLLIGMVEQLFPDCKIKRHYDELSSFTEAKVLGRQNKKESVAQRVMSWWNNYDWNGNELHIREILKVNNITQQQFNKAKSNNKQFKSFIDKHKGSKSRYYKC
ncbi:hypothetical protein ACTXGU_00070 [Niallia sp. 01092]|uniref:hypothetical protein n=1 Tax=Niallia sp. 01092 TaxID=3457759 RepID=UPI003FD0B14F